MCGNEPLFHNLIKYARQNLTKIASIAPYTLQTCSCFNPDYCLSWSVHNKNGQTLVEAYITFSLCEKMSWFGGIKPLLSSQKWGYFYSEAEWAWTPQREDDPLTAHFRNTRVSRRTGSFGISASRLTENRPPKLFWKLSAIFEAFDTSVSGAL